MKIKPVYLVSATMAAIAFGIGAMRLGEAAQIETNRQECLAQDSLYLAQSESAIPHDREIIEELAVERCYLREATELLEEITDKFDTGVAQPFDNLLDEMRTKYGLPTH